MTKIVTIILFAKILIVTLVVVYSLSLTGCANDDKYWVGVAEVVKD